MNRSAPQVAGSPTSSDAAVRRILRAAAAIGASLAIIGSTLFMLSGNGGLWWSEFVALVTVFAVFFGVLVWLVIPQQPHNAVVWTMAASAFFGGLAVVGEAMAGMIIDDPDVFAALPDVIPADLQASASWMLAVAEPAAIMTFFPLLTFGLLLFPDGRLPSPSWRWVGWLAALGILATTAGLAWSLRPWNTGLADEALLIDAGLVALTAAIVLCFTALVRRYRGSSGIVREQFKWIAWAASIFVPPMAVAIILGGTEYEFLTLFPLMAASVVFVSAYGIAVGKYRLYDIDPVVNKTVMVAALVSIVAALYVAVVAGVGLMFESSDGPGFGVQVAAAAVVAVAFAPARRWAQQWANRVVYGERATTYEVLARFSHRAAKASDDELLARVPRLIVDGTGAAEATLWVKGAERYRAATTWPDATEPREIAVAEEFIDPDADFSLPVHHDGELLGGLSLVRGRGEALSPGEESLVANLASGMGLALRNTRLTAELRDRVIELEASRERVLAAADEARRALERDLDSGPQQQLVALKVMLGPTRKQAEEAGATKTAEVLAQLESEAGDAIQAVREFSGGVYPPLLEAEGLLVAIRHRTDKSALRVEVDAGALGRYPREIEAAIYFTILEALQNVSKYADASSVNVVVDDSGGDLRFEVSDNGVGFHPAQVTAGSGLTNMSDRLDAVGGTLAIESLPAKGTVVSGRVPVAAVASA